MTAQVWIFDDFAGDDDMDSIASLESDDGEFHPVECILTEIRDRHRIWYLVKWENCPLVRSSWEKSTSDTFTDRPDLINTWKALKKRQDEGKSKPFDLRTFERAYREVEKLERQRRILRRLKRHVKGHIAVVTAP